MKKDIIWFGNCEYDSHFKVSSNHYSELAAKKGHRVLFINPPVSLLHVFSKSGRKRIKNALRGIYTGFDNYKVFTPLVFLTPAKKLPNFLNFIYKHWFFLSLNGLLTRLKNYSNKDKLVIVDYFAYKSIVDYLEINRDELIVRIVDDTTKFDNKFNKNVGLMEEWLIRNSGKVVFTALSLENKLRKLNSNCIYVPNGVDFSQYREDHAIPRIYEKTREPRIAVYVGNIERWFQFDLLKQVARENTDYHFYIIGPREQMLDQILECEELKNITFLGIIPNKELAPYLQYSDVGIIPFDPEDELVKAVSPVKMFEYMASGLPVIASKWDELSRIESPAYLVQNHVDFTKALSEISIREDFSIEIEYARSNDWSKKLDEILL